MTVLRCVCSHFEYLLLGAALYFSGCHAQGCPPKTAQVTIECRAAVKAGTKTPEQCNQEIEASCP